MASPRWTARTGSARCWSARVERLALHLADVARRKPDVVVLPSEPYPFAERHREEIAAKVPNAHVVLVDGRDLVWWGSRSGAAVQRLGSVMDGLRGARPPQ